MVQAQTAAFVPAVTQQSQQSASEPEFTDIFVTTRKKTMPRVHVPTATAAAAAARGSSEGVAVTGSAAVDSVAVCFYTSQSRSRSQ
jgi:hypothetical protein